MDVTPKIEGKANIVMWIIANGCFPIAVSGYLLLQVTDKLQTLSVMMAQQQTILYELARYIK